MTNSYIFTSESVSEGHPDKVCDQISDAILDAYLSIDKNAKVGCETFATTNTVIVGGEARITNGKTLPNEEIEKIIRNTIKEIGYEQDGFNWKTVKITNLIHEQSADIAIGVDVGRTEENEGAGDQGLMFGYACDETEDYMPSAIYYSHKLLKNIMNDIKNGTLKDLGPDAKAQITLKYENGLPVKAEKVLVSIQHREHIKLEDLRKIIISYIEKTLPQDWIPDDKNILVNPTGRFVIGGPDGDAGLTGRKIIVDTYGGYAPHGGGAFSGKDPSKVDRSAAYVARYLAKNVVASGLAKQCLIQISYAIGVAEPLSFYVNCNGTAVANEDLIAKKLRELVDLRPAKIVERLNLKNPIYKKTAKYGHFGRKPESDGSFSWEKLDLVEELKKLK